MRAAIFIDGGYVLKAFQDAKINPDYAKFTDYFLAPLRKQIPIDLLRCYFYYCPPWMSQIPTEDELRRMAAHEKFVEDIESIERWKVRLGKLEKRRDGDSFVFAQKRVDVMLSVDMVRHAAAGHIQHAVLIAGDSDFIPAVNAAQEHGVTITLVCSQDRSAHRDLLKLADEVLYFDWKKIPTIKAVPKTDINVPNANQAQGKTEADVGNAPKNQSRRAPQQKSMSSGSGNTRNSRGRKPASNS